MTRPVAYDQQAHADYLKGAFEANPYSKDSLALARTHLEQAVERNPSYARANGELAYTYVNMLISGWFPEEDSEELWQKALSHAERAVALDPNDYINHWNLAHLLVNTGKDADFEKGLAEFEVALDLFNNNTDPMDRKPGLLSEYGEILVYGGEIKRGIELMQKALRPPDWYHWTLAFGHYCDKDYKGAVDSLDRMNAKPGDERFLLPALLLRGAAEALRGNQPAAKEAVERYFSLSPSVEVAKHIVAQELAPGAFRSYAEPTKMSAEVKELSDRWNDGLEKAGFTSYPPKQS